MFNKKGLALVLLSGLLCGCDSIEKNDQQLSATAEEKVMLLVSGMNSDFQSCKSVERAECDFVFDTKEKIRIHDISINKLDHQNSACGIISGVSMSGKVLNDSFVIPDIETGQAIYLKIPRYTGSVSASVAYNEAEKKFCK